MAIKNRTLPFHQKPLGKLAQLGCRKYAPSSNAVPSNEPNQVVAHYSYTGAARSKPSAFSCHRARPFAQVHIEFWQSYLLCRKSSPRCAVEAQYQGSLTDGLVWSRNFALMLALLKGSAARHSFEHQSVPGAIRCEPRRVPRVGEFKHWWDLCLVRFSFVSDGGQTMRRFLSTY